MKGRSGHSVVSFFIISTLLVCESFLVFIFFFFKVSGAVRHLGYEAEWRDKEDHDKSAVHIIDPSQGAPIDGIVTGWHVYTTRGRRSQVVHLQIWRPVDILHPLLDRTPPHRSYRHIGETLIAARWVGHNFFALYPVDRIEVRKGDVLGIFFPGYNPIPWSAVPCNRSNEHLVKNVTGRFVIGAAEIMFERSRWDSNQCRHYSLNATLMDEDEVLQYDYDYEDTTDGRYERRPYGRYLRKRRFNGATIATVVCSLPPPAAIFLPILSVSCLTHFRLFSHS